MNKKLVVAMLLLIVMAVIPWIWVYQQFGGLTNIPHYDIMMWDFMLDYFLLVSLMFVGILAGFQSDSESLVDLKSEYRQVIQELRQKKEELSAAHSKKTKENGIEHLAQLEPSEEAAAGIEKEKPEEQEISEELAPEELQEQPQEPPVVEAPEEWEERKYE